MKLKDKVIVITGSTRGIGWAIAKACAGAGASVVISSRNEKAVQEKVQILKQQGYKASGIKCDVFKEGDLEKLLNHALTTWGKVDVWINNAGLSGGYRPLEEMEAEEIEALVNVNLTAVIKACRLAISYFNEKGEGIIINMSGKGGQGSASPYTAVYSATKTAVSSLTKSLARENKGKRISVQTVVPGMVKTDFHKNAKRSPKLEKVADSLPYIFNAFGVPVEEVGRFFIKLAAQEPGKNNGKTFSLLSGKRLWRAIFLLMWYRLTGKIKTA